MSNPLRLLTIPVWLCLHYLFAGLIVLFAEPSPTVSEIEAHTGNIINRVVIGAIFLFFAVMLAVDYNVTPRRFVLYASGWGAYTLAAAFVAVDHLITRDPIPGQYLNVLSYIDGLIFMSLAYSVYGSVAQISKYIAQHEPRWKMLLSRTDLDDYEEP